jgi:hypothetical protein
MSTCEELPRQNSAQSNPVKTPEQKQEPATTAILTKQMSECSQELPADTSEFLGKAAKTMNKARY